MNTLYEIKSMEETYGASWVLRVPLQVVLGGYGWDRVLRIVNDFLDQFFRLICHDHKERGKILREAFPKPFKQHLCSSSWMAISGP